MNIENRLKKKINNNIRGSPTGGWEDASFIPKHRPILPDPVNAGEGKY